MDEVIVLDDLPFFSDFMSQLVLINIRGEDRPGLLNGLMEPLGFHDVEVLDVAQSVIHDDLSYGMLVNLRGPENQHGLVFRDLMFRAHELGVAVTFKPLSDDDHERWLEGFSESRYIVTLLSKSLRAEQVSKATGLFSEHGLNVETIRRLSRPVSMKSSTGSDFACIEFGVRGCPTDGDGLKKAFLDLSAAEEMDLAFQRDDVFRRHRKLVVFDMDSTLLKIEVIDELARHMNVVDKVSVITEAAMAGEIDFDESFRRRVALLRGMPRSVIDKIISNMPLNDGAERLVRTLKSVGYKVAILSGGFSYFVEELQQRLGVDYGFANSLVFENNVATGEVDGEIINGERKLHYMKQIAEREHIALKQVIAVGDGANDLPMISAAGLGVAFRAKPLVKASADHSLTTMGLDGVLYLLGFNDLELSQL